MQPQGHAQVIVNMVDFGMNLQEAGDAARINHTGSSQPTGTMMTDGGVVWHSARTRVQRRHTLGDRTAAWGPATVGEHRRY